MTLILQRDIRQLMLNVEKVQGRFDMLEQNHSTLDMQCQQDQNHLMELIEHIKRLESHVSTMLLDCESLGRRYWKDRNPHLIESLHGSFATMETLFSDLKKLRNTLSEAYINPSDLQKLVIDWARFKKSTERIQKSMQHTQKRRKTMPGSLRGAKGTVINLALIPCIRQRGRRRTLESPAPFNTSKLQK